MADKFRVTVTLTVSLGQYGYNRIGEKEFEVVGSEGVLWGLDLGDSVRQLYYEALHLIGDTEEEGEGDE